jgi:chemotaxis protein CheX
MENSMARKDGASTGKKPAPSMDDGSHMDTLMTHALLDSLFTIFSTMVKLKIQPGVPELKQGNVARGEVSALIGMNAEGVSGSVALTLTLPTVRVISRGLLGHEIDSIDKDAADMTGELTNIMVGGVKRFLSEMGHDFDMQTPQLLRGEGHEIVHPSAGRTVLLPVMVEGEVFYIELHFS